MLCGVLVDVVTTALPENCVFTSLVKIPVYVVPLVGRLPVVDVELLELDPFDDVSADLGFFVASTSAKPTSAAATAPPPTVSAKRVLLVIVESPIFGTLQRTTR